MSRRVREVDLERQLIVITDPRQPRYTRIQRIRNLVEMLVMAGFGAPQVARDIYGLLLNYFVPNEALSLVTEGILMGGSIIYSSRRMAYRIMAGLEASHRATKRQLPLQFGVRKKRNVSGGQLAISDRAYNSSTNAPIASTEAPIASTEAPMSQVASNPYKYMYGKTPHSVSHSTDINIYLDKYGKGGKRGDRYHHLEVIKDVFRREEWHSTHSHGINGVKRFAHIPSERAVVTGSLDEQISWEVATNRPFTHFNSVYQLFVLRNLVHDGTFTYPSYETDIDKAIREPLQNPGDMEALVCLKNQRLHMTVKNVSANPTVTSVSETPIDLVVYVVQTTKDIVLRYNDQQTVQDQFNMDLQEAFHNVFDFETTPVTNAQLLYDLEQPCWVTYKQIDNIMREKGYKVLESHRRYLLPGQELNINATLRKPQVLSYQFTGHSQYQGRQETGTPGVYRNDYAPIVYKKGEMFLFFCTKGSIAEFADNIVKEEKIKMIVRGYQTYNGIGLYKEPTKKKLTINPSTGAAANQLDDLDAHHAQ